MPAPKYSPEQKAEALKIHEDRGPAEAARQTGIPKNTIASWAKRGGVQTDAVANTKAATEMAKAARGIKRENLRELILDKAIDMLHRMDERHKDFKGKDADEVWWDKAPAGACKDYATSAAILVDKFRLEVGESTERTEHIGRAEKEAEVINLFGRKTA